MHKPVHKSTITLQLEVQDGVFEERYALSCEEVGPGLLAVMKLLDLVTLRRDCLIRGFAWGPKPSDEPDQFSLTEESK